MTLHPSPPLPTPHGSTCGSAGYGLLTLTPDEYVTLQEGEPQPGAPLACIGAGTGLGECYLTTDGGGVPTCWGSEGGHTEWSPRNDVDVGLQRYLQVIRAIGAEGLNRRGPAGSCRLFLGPGFRIGARWNRPVGTVKTWGKMGEIQPR